jgi:hypothetical protein
MNCIAAACNVYIYEHMKHLEKNEDDEEDGIGGGERDGKGDGEGDNEEDNEEDDEGEVGSVIHIFYDIIIILFYLL